MSKGKIRLKHVRKKTGYLLIPFLKVSKGHKRAFSTLIFLFTVLAGCYEQPSISIKPSEQVSGVITNVHNSPVEDAYVYLSKLEDGQVVKEVTVSVSDSKGTFILDLPRHETHGSKFLIEVQGAAGFPYYGFGTSPKIRIDLVSTVLYEYIKSMPNPVDSFRAVQLQELLLAARTLINEKIENGLIQTDVEELEILHNAFRNALSSDEDFIAGYTLLSLENGYNVEGLIPFEEINTVPQIVDRIPTVPNTTLNEGKYLSFNVTARDNDDDHLFYVWKINDKIVLKGLHYFDYEPDYFTVPWTDHSLIKTVTAIASDGGRLDKKSWNVTVYNQGRAPEFLTQPPEEGYEGEGWNYVPAARSPDNAPFRIRLSSGVMLPMGMDMCICSGWELNDALHPLKDKDGNFVCAAWVWQTAFENDPSVSMPCDEPNMITWKPNNCNSVGPQFIQLEAVDWQNKTGYQRASVIVTDVNTPPVFNTGDPGWTDPPAAGKEWEEWSWQPYVYDHQAADPTDPNASPDHIQPNIGGKNRIDAERPGEDFYHGPDVADLPLGGGGVGCPDELVFTLEAKGKTMEIDSKTGLITWKPDDDDTGLVNVRVRVTDRRPESSAVYSFVVDVENLEREPYFVSPDADTTKTILVDKYTTQPFIFEIFSYDPDRKDREPGTNLHFHVIGAPSGMAFSQSVKDLKPPVDLVAAPYYKATWFVNDVDTDGEPEVDPETGVGTYDPVTHEVTVVLCDTNPANNEIGIFPEHEGEPVFQCLGGVEADPQCLCSGPPEELPPDFQWCPDPDGFKGHLCVTRNYVFELPKRNFAPKITKLTDLLATGETEFVYEMKIEDKNTNPVDDLVFELVVDSEDSAYGRITLTVDNPDPENPMKTSGPLATARLNWTPNNIPAGEVRIEGEEEIKGDLGQHDIKVCVTDLNDFPPDGGNQKCHPAFIYVRERNYCPTLEPISSQIGSNGMEFVCEGNPEEGSEGSDNPCKVIASDPNVVEENSRITYTLLGDTPEGMSIDASSGRITWEPTIIQARDIGSFAVNVGIQDDGSVPYQCTPDNCPEGVCVQRFDIELSYINRGPKLDPISDQIIPKGMPFAFAVTATDPDGDPVTLSAQNLPEDSDFNAETGIFTWTPTAKQTVNMVFRADSFAHDPAGMPDYDEIQVEIQVVSKPLFLSHPIVNANVGDYYNYEVHALDPSQTGLTFSLPDSSPEGMSIVNYEGENKASVLWQPAQLGGYEVVIIAQDGEGTKEYQEYYINVTEFSPNTPPSVSSVSPPNTSVIVLSEGTLNTFTVDASDHEHTIHYAWYLDDNWLGDELPMLELKPLGDQGGDHELKVVITDGADSLPDMPLSVTWDLHIRNTIPVIGDVFDSFDYGSMVLMGLSDMQEAVVTVRSGVNPTLDIFSESGLESGPVESVSDLPFNPRRLAIRTYPLPELNFGVYMSYSGDISTPVYENMFRVVFFEDMVIETCGGSSCWNNLFESSYKFTGGTNVSYDLRTRKRFNINSEDRSLLSWSCYGTEKTPLFLGESVLASSLLYDRTHLKLFVSIYNEGKVMVFTVPLSCDDEAGQPLFDEEIVTGAGPSAMYMNHATGMLFIYNAIAGSLSKILVSDESNTLQGNIMNFDPAPSVVFDPSRIIAGNDMDDILYMANPDTSRIFVLDNRSDQVRTLDMLSPPDVIFFNSYSNRVSGACYGGGAAGHGRIFLLK